MSSEAIVTSVRSDKGAVLINAYPINRSSNSFTNVPLLTDFGGAITVPKKGQKVIISKTDGGTEYVEGVLTVFGEGAPPLDEAEYALQFDPDTTIKAEKDGSGGFNITVNASGDVTIGDAENADELAVQNHTHEYSGTDSNGDSFSGTTSTPNESGTDSRVE